MSCGLAVLTPYIITGDCDQSNSGGFSINMVGGGPPFYINWISPSYPTTTVFSGTYSLNGLSAGTYSFTVTNSCFSGPETVPVNIYISSGTCVSISGIDNTTCSLNNGSITASTVVNYGSSTYQLYDFETDTLLSSQTNVLNPFYVFTSLSAGTYYVIANDGAGCTGRSESCIVKSSTTLDFGFYVVDDAGCTASGSGAVYVTGLTGNPPYTYSWYPDGETTSFVTGKTNGPQSVTVTDSTGCVTTKGVSIVEVPNVGLASFIVDPPDCFTSNGEVTIIVTGGTPPYYYSGTNGVSQFSYGTSYTFTGLSAGLFTIEVTDLGLCKLITSTLVLNPNGFSVSAINVTPSNCSNASGQIQIILTSGISNFTYELKNSSGVTQTQNTGVICTFVGLASDTYELTIDGGDCSYTTTIELENNEAFIVDYNVTGTTCNGCDGAIELIVSGGVPNYLYNLNGFTDTLSLSSRTFTDLCSGTYVGSITDNTLCEITKNIIIPNSPTVSFSLFGTNPSSYSNNGSVSALITDGTPPFTLTWSSNVNGQTGLTVNNLSAGTYTLNVQDVSGCSYTSSITLVGYVPLSNYQVYNVCDSDFANTGLLLTKGIQQMLNEGFYDLTSGDTNCILNEAVFTAIVKIDDSIKDNTFYVSNSLGDYPSDQLWVNTIKEMLLSFSGIQSVDVNIGQNTVKITTPCNTLSGSNVIVDLLISYDISCQEIE